MNDEERKNKRESKGQPSNLFNPQVNMGVVGLYLSNQRGAVCIPFPK